MEYPGTKFTKPWRMAVLTIFIIAFFVIAPILVLHTMGYRYDWENHNLKQTGALSVDINPKTGEVLLNNITLEKNTFDKKIEVNNLKKGKYDLVIKTPDYFDWEKEIEIKDKQTNYIKEINLIKKTTAQKLLDKDIKQFWLSPDFNYILFTIQTENDLEVWLYAIIDKTTNLILKTKDTGKLSVDWSIQYNCTTITQNNNFNELNILCIDKTANLTELPTTTSTINKIQWKNSTVPELNYSTKEEILAWLPTVKQKKYIAKNNYLDWYLDDNKLWTMQINTTSQEYIITKDTLGFASTFAQIKTNQPYTGKTEYNLLYSHNNTILLKQANLSEMVLINEETKHTISGDKYYISPHNNWWIIWTPWELWTYIEGGSPELQNRSGETLLEVTPLDQYNALALMWKQKTDVLFPYYLVNHNLINTQTNHISADSTNRVLYFTKTDESGLWTLAY